MLSLLAVDSGSPMGIASRDHSAGTHELNLVERPVKTTVLVSLRPIGIDGTG